ncbi:hypothetical protein ABVT39_021691 [Epinephelus coioides]
MASSAAPSSPGPDSDKYLQNFFQNVDMETKRRLDGALDGGSIDAYTKRVCYKIKIGVASKTCQHCGGKQPYKDKVERQKEKITQDWKERQKRDCSINTVHDATNLLL